jgi:hypothetical protein
MTKLSSIRVLFVAVVLLTIAFTLSFGAPPSGKCIVCHNDKNPHEISIPCDEVEKYLKNHPGDYAGPCKPVSPEQPTSN